MNLRKVTETAIEHSPVGPAKKLTLPAPVRLPFGPPEVATHAALQRKAGGMSAANRSVTQATTRVVSPLSSVPSEPTIPHFPVRLSGIQVSRQTAPATTPPQPALPQSAPVWDPQDKANAIQANKQFDDHTSAARHADVMKLVYLLIPDPSAAGSLGHEYFTAVRKNNPRYDATIEELTVRVRERQIQNAESTQDGKLTEEWVRKKIASIPNYRMWESRDFHAIRAEEQAAKQIRGDDEAKIRQRIVNLALSQVGTNDFELNRGDEKRFGWERVARYFEVAYKDSPINKLTDIRFIENNPDVPEGDRYVSAIFGKDVTKDPAGFKTTPPPALHGGIGGWLWKTGMKADRNANWCGIFATWVVRTVTGRGMWNGSTGITGLAKASKPDAGNLPQPGDILVEIFRRDPQGNRVLMYHHSIVVSVDPSGQTCAVVDGNEPNKVDNARSPVPLSDVDYYYRAVDPPLSP